MLSYSRTRATFGRYLKLKREDKVLFDYGTNKKKRETFKPKDRVSRFASNCIRYRNRIIRSMSTKEKIDMQYHSEGGWMEDIDPNNMVDTARYRKKMEKSEDINNTIDKWGQMLENRVIATEVGPTEDRFDIEEDFDIEVTPYAELACTYSDPSEVTRPLTRVAWLNPGHIVATYANTLYGYDWSDDPSDFYLWNLEISTHPIFTLKSTTPAYCIETHEENVDILLTGHLSGGLALWDIRGGCKPVAVTSNQYAHGEIVKVAQWTLHEAGYEVFSGGSEGTIKWWDTRNLSEPFEEICTGVCAGEKYSAPLGVTSLEVNVEEPQKYVVGTESGHILYGDRSAELSTDRLVMNWRIQAYVGPVLCMERHDECSDFFLTCGDYKLKIFSDDLMYSPIMSILPQASLITWATWSASHPAVAHTTRQDGFIDSWNLTLDLGKPINRMKVCEERLLVAKTRQEGDLLALGSHTGDLHLVRYSTSVFLGEDEDDTVLDELFSRELGREKQVVEKALARGFSAIKVTAVDEVKLSFSEEFSGSDLEKWEDEEEIGEEELETAMTNWDLSLNVFPPQLERPPRRRVWVSGFLEEEEEPEPNLMGDYHNAEVEVCERNFWKLAKEHEEHMKKFRPAPVHVDPESDSDDLKAPVNAKPPDDNSDKDTDAGKKERKKKKKKKDKTKMGLDRKKEGRKKSLAKKKSVPKKKIIAKKKSLPKKKSTRTKTKSKSKPKSSETSKSRTTSKSKTPTKSKARSKPKPKVKKAFKSKDKSKKKS